jgi:dTDP-glucose 4,6-dehydratase/UDP-glucuronate decarboxylase
MSAAEMTAEEVRDADLAYIVDSLATELPQMEGGRLLITGGAGFLGYYLVQSILFWNRNGARQPIAVTLVDNFRRGAPAWLEALGDRRDLALITHDITLPVPPGVGPADYVIHAAGIASPALYRQIPIETMDANVGGLRRLLDASIAWAQGGSPLKGFLFYSSSEIYGDPVPEAIPTPETYRGNVSCTGPRACYDESKRYGETLAVNFARVHLLPITIARPFNNYGPGMKINDGRVIADFCGAVIDSRDIVMFSDGSPTRTFCYVADAVVGYFKVLVAGEPGEPYNIGTDAPEISMRELADQVVAVGQELFGYRGRVVIEPSSEADYLIDNPGRRCPDLTKARTDLGYDPAIGLAEGVKRTLQWYAGNRSGVGV